MIQYPPWTSMNKGVGEYYKVFCIDTSSIYNQIILILIQGRQYASMLVYVSPIKILYEYWFRVCRQFSFSKPLPQSFNKSCIHNTYKYSLKHFFKQAIFQYLFFHICIYNIFSRWLLFERFQTCRMTIFEYSGSGWECKIYLWLLWL